MINGAVSATDATMDYVYKLVGSVRSIVFTCKSRNHVSSVDPMVRSALAETVEHDREEWQDDLATVQADLERVALAWQQSMDREQFLDTRIRKYRKKLRERSKELAETPHEPDYEQRRQTLDRDDSALRQVQESHQQILVQCETMRRQLKELERKRDEMIRMDNKLHSFVDRAALSSSSASHNDQDPTPQQREHDRKVDDEPQQPPRTTAAGPTTGSTSPEADDHTDPEAGFADKSSSDGESSRKLDRLPADCSDDGFETGADLVDAQTEPSTTKEDLLQKD
jgi:myosin heavy subunit